MHSFSLATGLLGTVAAAPFQYSDSFSTMNTIRGARNVYTRIDTSTDTEFIMTKDNILYGTVAGPET